MEQLKNESETELQNQSEIEMQNQSEAEMRDEKYMKEALKKDKKAYALEEAPIGCVIVHEGKSLPVDTTAAIQIKVRLLMQKFPQ